MIAVFDDGRVERTLTHPEPDCAGHLHLQQWVAAGGPYAARMRDYHRMQVERWVADRLQPWPRVDRVLDIGVIDRRDWIGPGYRTGGLEDMAPDLVCDLEEGIPGTWDVILCTEVLEHVRRPWVAVAHLREALVPGGRLIASAPFLWPDHRTDMYADYWRFTEQGWHALLADWQDVRVVPCQWTTAGACAYRLLIDVEGMGLPSMVRGTTGYLIEARR